MTEVTVRLTGATHEWLQWNTSWGTEHDEPAARAARERVLAAQRRRVGKHGSAYTVALMTDEAVSLWLYLGSLAEVGESMSAEERGDDAYAYRAVRRDTDRLEDVLADAGVDLEEALRAAHQKIRAHLARIARQEA